MMVRPDDGEDRLSKSMAASRWRVRSEDDPATSKRGRLLWKRTEPSRRMARPLPLRVPLKYALLFGLLVLVLVLPWFADTESYSILAVAFIYLGLFFGWLFILINLYFTVINISGFHFAFCIGNVHTQEPERQTKK